MTIRLARLLPYALRLKHAWPSAEGPLTERRGWILALEEEDGAIGLGEAAPWPGFGLESVASAGAALKRALERLAGLPSERYAQAVEQLGTLAPVVAAPTARHAIDLALHDLMAKRAGCSVARLLGRDAAIDAVPANAVIARLEAKEGAEEAARAAAEGATTIKLKVGGAPLAHDVERVRAVREAIGPSLRLRLDANQSWTAAEAGPAIAALRLFNLEYVEQPLPAHAIEAMAALRASCGVPIAADESVRDLATARRLLDRGAADVLIVKPMALGGLGPARAVAALALERGAGVVVTSLLESAVGRLGALHAAASLGPLDHAHGVAGGILERDLAETPRLRGGVIALPSGHGLGVELPAALWTEAVVAEAP
jgi:o-succinylbenzoate synthase